MKKIFQGNHDAVEPWLGSQKWDAAGNPKTINAQCTTLEKYSFQCQNKPCRNNGKCYGGKTTFYCDCPSGWTGITCTIPGIPLNFLTIKYRAEPV